MTNYRRDGDAIHDRIRIRVRERCEREARRLRTRCSWCQQLICDGPLSPEGKESHGICATCDAKVFPHPPEVE